MVSAPFSRPDFCWMGALQFDIISCVCYDTTNYAKEENIHG